MLASLGATARPRLILTWDAVQLDAGVDEKLMLVSRDETNVLICSYREVSGLPRFLIRAARVAWQNAVLTECGGRCATVSRQRSRICLGNDCELQVTVEARQLGMRASADETG